MAACDNPVRAETSNVFHVPVGSFNDCKFQFDIQVVLLIQLKSLNFVQFQLRCFEEEISRSRFEKMQKKRQ
jgi:hypothetical protein